MTTSSSTTTTTVAVGIVCAIGSAVFNGSYTSLFKTRRMARIDIHPIVFQLYVCMGIFLSSWLVVPFFDYNDALVSSSSSASSSAAASPPEKSSHYHLQFSTAGMIAGFLFVLAASASFLAVQKIGVALAQGIWGGGAMLVSYLWGTLAFGEYPSHIGLSICALLLLLVGVFVVAFCEKIGKHIIRKGCDNGAQESSPLLSGDHESDNDNDDNNATTTKDFVSGVLWACTVGLSGGSILAPMHYVSPEKQGLIFLPSFGIGTLILSPIVYGIYSYTAGQAPPLHLGQATLTGLLSGLVWNTGNLLSIIAIPAITYGVAYPIMQCAIFVSGIWGVYVFGEIRNRTTIIVFWTGGCLLILGGLVLTVAR